MKSITDNVEIEQISKVDMALFGVAMMDNFTLFPYCLATENDTGALISGGIVLGISAYLISKGIYQDVRKKYF